MGKKPRLGGDPFLPQISDSRQAKEETQVEVKTKTETFAETFAEKLKRRAGEGAAPKKFEEVRKRQTYWLTPEEIETIDQLAKKTGASKYEVIGAAIELLNSYVFDR